MKTTFYSIFKPHYETIAPPLRRRRRRTVSQARCGRVRARTTAWQLGVGRTLARVLLQAFERAYAAAGEAVTAAQVSGQAGFPVVPHGRAMRAAARGLDEGADAIGRG